MGFPKIDDRIVIKKHYERGMTIKEIVKLVRPIGIKQRFVYRTVKRLQETGSIKDRKRSGRPRTARTKERIRRVQMKIQRNPQRSARKLAKEEGVSDFSMRQIIKVDLKLKPYKKRVVHGLTTKQRDTRKERCQMLLDRYNNEKIKKIIFSDEKLFVVEQYYNAQNIRVYSGSFENIPEHLKTVQRFQNASSIMVWAGISHRGKLPLVFIDKGVKINANFYQSDILQAQLKPEADKLYPNHDWIFQQDSAPAHKARTNQDWCRNNCPAFISAAEWPPSSPDLNPLDYCIWGILEPIINAKQHHSLESMKRMLVQQWDKLTIKTVRDAIGVWRSRLQRVVDAGGGRFE